MNAKLTLILSLILFSFNYSCKKNVTTTPSPGGTVTGRPGPPNIIFLLGDDVGYEMPTFDGGSSYDTPHLDSLAANAMVFNQCRATGLCSPSRVELLSGLYNFRNYLQYGWGIYNNNYISYAKVLQNNGYQTCVVGKWQLEDGLIGIKNVGFDNWCILDYSYNLYRSPTFHEDSNQDNLTASIDNNKYSEDITGSYVSNFIDQNKNRPFFLYYSFLLIHMPDQPTPLDPNYLTWDENLADTTYIGSMTHYLDVKVGALMNKLKADGLEKNTIIVFSGDNGSEGNYHSIFKGKSVAGEKGQVTEMGTHVPLFVYWPGHITPGANNNLVDFSDFAPTFLDMAKVKSKPSGWDGVSFYPQLFGDNSNARTWTYCYWDPVPVPLPGAALTKPVSYAQDISYKLYKTGPKSGNFYHFTVDLEERNPIPDKLLTAEQAAIKQKLQTALTKYP